MRSAGISRVVNLGISFGMRGMIRAYQLLLAPVLPPSCRFYPSCSHYAAEAVALHGPWRGMWLAARRILRCHPWGGSGYDPVPSEPASPGPAPLEPAPLEPAH